MTKYIKNLQPPCVAIILIGPSYAIIGSVVSLIAEVFPHFPGYEVIFLDNGNQIGSVPTNGDGIASLNWDTSNVMISGNHSIMAIASGCPPMAITMYMAYSPCTISLSADPPTIQQGGMVTLTTNTNAAPTTPYRILFRDEGNVIASRYLQPNGMATWVWDTSTAFIGPHNMTTDAMIITNGIQCTGNTTVTVNPCMPNWQCELPPNGYESDSCGNRRLNPKCDIAIGNVQIISIPAGARIFIDDVDTGLLTPAILLDLISGSHTYKLTLPGYVDATGIFDIIDGQETTITETLSLIPGNLSITSIPPGATIFIDDIEQKGIITPAMITDLSAGTHTYKLTLVGYYDTTDTFDIITDQTIPINVTMTKVPSQSSGGMMILGLTGIAALGMMMTAKPIHTSPGHRTVGEISATKGEISGQQNYWIRA